MRIFQATKEDFIHFSGLPKFPIYPDKFSVTEAHIKLHDIIGVCTKSEYDKLRHHVYMGNIISRGISSVA